MNIIGFSTVGIKTQSGFPLNISIAELDEAVDIDNASSIRISYQGVLPPCPCIIIYNSTDNPLPDVWGEVPAYQSGNSFVCGGLGGNTIPSGRVAIIKFIFRDTLGNIFYLAPSTGDGNYSYVTELPSVNKYGTWHYPYSYNWGFSVSGQPGFIRAFVEQCKSLLAGATGLDNDPYSPGGPSGPGHGDGTFDFSSTDIPIPGLPTISASDTGFVSLYRATSAELKTLANYLWSSSFDIDNLKKMFVNPMDVILGCHIVPITSTGPVGVASTLVVGNISSGISMTKLSGQYYELDCGTVQILPKWGAYLDFSPYSKLALFLPYIGMVDISPDDCMNGSIRVVYHIDALSGSCIAFVYCYSNNGANGHTLYTFTGNCSIDVPVTEGQYANLFQVIGGSFRAAAGFAGAGAKGIAGASSLIDGVSDTISTVQSVIKPDVVRSGNFGASAGLMGIQYPYLILTIPKMCIPGYQNTYIGYPSFVTMEIGEISGYTEVQVSHLNNMTCTNIEAEEIIALLSKGVIL